MEVEGFVVSYRYPASQHVWRHVFARDEERGGNEAERGQAVWWARRAAEAHAETFRPLVEDMRFEPYRGPLEDCAYEMFDGGGRRRTGSARGRR